MAGEQLEKRLDTLAAALVGNANHRAGGNCRMFDNLGFDFSRTDSIAGSLDDIVVAALEINVALIVHVAHITSQAPFAGELVAHRGGIFPVFLHHHWAIAPDTNLSSFARFNR